MNFGNTSPLPWRLVFFVPSILLVLMSACVGAWSIWSFNTRPRIAAEVIRYEDLVSKGQKFTTPIFRAASPEAGGAIYRSCISSVHPPFEIGSLVSIIPSALDPSKATEASLGNFIAGPLIFFTMGIIGLVISQVIGKRPGPEWCSRWRMG